MPTNSARSEMPDRELGRTGERVSAIGLGGWHLGLPQIEERLSVRIIREAIDRGIKTTSIFDATALNPAWLGEEPERVRQIFQP